MGRKQVASKTKSRGRSKDKVGGKSRSRSKSGSKRKSEGKSKGRSRKKSKSRSGSKASLRFVNGKRRSAGKSGGDLLADAGKTLDKDSVDFFVPVLMEGESLLIGRHISELEIILYRSVPEKNKLPLFFDTTACLFSESGGQTDYVGVGRSTTNNKGLLHRPHAVLQLNTASEASKNLLEPAGGLPVIAGDSVLINLRKVAMWSGLSLCATLFTTDFVSSETIDMYYAVKKPEVTLPMAIVPITLTNSSQNSCIALMIRKVKANSKAAWELVRVGETLEQQDIKGVLTALQGRGLRDPAAYRLLPSYGSDFDSEGTNEAIPSLDDNDDDYDDDDDDDDDDSMETSFGRQIENLEDLLIQVPRVAREGRRQYSVGRSILNNALEAADSSDENEVMEDALRAVVPRYTSPCPVRYEDKTYNVGSREETLARHYVSHREEYGLTSPVSPSGGGTTALPMILSSPSGTWHRFSLGTTGIARPAAPPELLVTLPTALRCKSGVWKRGGRSSLSSPRHSTRRRRSKSRGRKGKGRRGRSKKSGSRRSGSKHKKSSKSRSGSKGPRRRRSGKVRSGKKKSALESSA